MEPLAGLTVVELGHSIAGPFAGAVLAQLGAEVIKIENPEGGDHARDWGPPWWGGTSTVFHALNRDKMSVAVDLKKPELRDNLNRFILDRADVVLSNLRPGVAEDLGLGAEALRADKPQLIYCVIGSFGAVGPLSNKPGYDPLMQAYCGLMSVTGEAGRPPVREGTSINDMGSGMWAAHGIVAAVASQRAGGGGCTIHTSLYETAIAWMSTHLPAYLASGEVRAPIGSGTFEIVPYQAFATSDSYLMVAAGNDGLYRKLCDALGRGSLASEPRFVTNSERVKNREALIEIIAPLFLARTAAQWGAVLDAAGVPNAPIQTIDQVAAAPQTEALGVVQYLESETRFGVCGLPLSFDGVRPPLRSYGPALGANNAVLGAPPMSAMRSTGGNS